MRNISTRIFSKRFDYQNSIGTISHVSDGPSTGHIIISTITSSPTNNHKIIMEITIEQISQIDISGISTITSIPNCNSPCSNIINEIAILITSNIYRQINNRNRINSATVFLISTVRTSKSCIIG